MFMFIPNHNILGSQQYLPVGIPQQTQQVSENNTQQQNDATHSRSVAYCADNSGCYAWRMGWPNQILQLYQKHTISEGCVMIFDENYYRGVSTVRVQRQATPHQLEFLKYLKNLSGKYGFKLVYEIDDIVFAEDIPSG